MKIYREEGERVIQVRNMGNSNSVTKTTKKGEKYGDPEVTYQPPAPTPPRSTQEKTKSGITGLSTVSKAIYDKFFPSVPKNERRWYGWGSGSQTVNALPLVVDKLARDYLNGNISASEIAKRAIRYRGMILPNIAYVPGTKNPLRIGSMPTKYSQVEFFKKLSTGNSSRTPLNTRKSNDL